MVMVGWWYLCGGGIDGGDIGGSGGGIDGEV